MGGCLCSREVGFKETSSLQASLLKDFIVTCPNHSWKLDLNASTYQNGIKKPL
ncbi:hypothetical protein predicted by Glimmer/Critica [Helicobacter acinonychis str. Sheeba]|uniref:Uncharacterized protein n=2 Tax=Helicobacter acinonychis TaxID=212 RepID=Q17ZE7_HELAH|nr:hypothetical protein predicted by Glimmer/Critica [Helicobacter acinonychis str. Sheeba]